MSLFSNPSKFEISELFHGHCTPALRIFPGPGRGADRRGGRASPAQEETATRQDQGCAAGMK